MSDANFSLWGSEMRLEQVAMQSLLPTAALLTEGRALAYSTAKVDSKEYHDVPVEVKKTEPPPTTAFGKFTSWLDSKFSTPPTLRVPSQADMSLLDGSSKPVGAVHSEWGRDDLDIYSVLNSKLSDAQGKVVLTGAAVNKQSSDDKGDITDSTLKDASGKVIGTAHTEFYFGQYGLDQRASTTVLRDPSGNILGTINYKTAVGGAGETLDTTVNDGQGKVVEKTHTDIKPAGVLDFQALSTSH